MFAPARRLRRRVVGAWGCETAIKKNPSCANDEEAKHLASAPTPCTLRLQSVMLKFLFDRDRRRLVEGSDCHGCAGRRRCQYDGRS